MKDELRKRIKSKIGQLKIAHMEAKDDLAENGANYDIFELDELVKTIDCTKYAVDVLQSILQSDHSSLDD